MVDGTEPKIPYYTEDVVPVASVFPSFDLEPQEIISSESSSSPSLSTPQVLLEPQEAAQGPSGRPVEDPFGRPGGPYTDAEQLIEIEIRASRVERRTPDFTPDNLDPFFRIPRQVTVGDRNNG